MAKTKTPAAETPPTTEAPTEDILLDLPIADLIIGKRIRQHYGDIETLAESIEKNRLQNRIVVVPSPDVQGKYLLVSGGRRVKAFEYLKRGTIPAVVKSIPNPLVAEADENNLREPFSKIEQLAIAEAIMATTPERRGRPSKEGENDMPIVDKESATDVNIVPQLGHIFLRPGEKTRDYAIRVSGLGGKTTYEQVKSVRDNAIQDVVDALSQKSISVNCAYEISQQPPKQQLSFLNTALSDDYAGQKKLRKQAAERRKAKRQRRVGLDPKATAASSSIEDIYNVVRVAPNFYNAKVEDMAKFPLHKHAAANFDTLVCIECPDPLLDKAFELQRAWGLIHYLTLRVERKDGSPIVGMSYTKDKPVHIVVGGFGKLPLQVFAEVRGPTTFTCSVPSAGARGVIKEMFGRAARGRLLDISSHEPCAGWTICKLNYSYGLF